jgi:LCP family protein required for cell wall assembly
MSSVNFLNVDHDAVARRKTLVLAGVFTLFVALVAFAGAAASYRSVERGTDVFTEFGRLPVISDVRQLVFGGNTNDTGTLTGKTDDEPNMMRILVLGIGGAGHDGSLLTDTIMIATVDLDNKKVGMVSIPRDMAYPRGDGTFEKINSIHAWEEQDHPGEGAIRTARKFSDFFGINIDHVVRIDFRGFAALIDALGGIDIDVARGFTDTQYPTLDEKWQTVSFKKGMQHMDGQTALIFVRSRHGNNGEGSDFARAARQQLVMLAVRQKLLSLNTLGDPGKLAKLYQAVTNHLQSDLSPWDAIKLAPLVEDFSTDKMVSHVLDDAENGELISTNLNNNYLLFPRGNDWSAIKSLIKNPFASEEERAKDAPNLAKVEVKNGTLHTGLAFQISNNLNLAGYQAQNMGNANRRNYTRTLLVDLTNGQKSDDLAKLRRQLDADVSLSTVTSTQATDGSFKRAVYAAASSLETIYNKDTDFLVILGESSYALVDNSYATQTRP